MNLTFQEEEILFEKVKQYPILLDKQLKGYKENNVINTWNAVSKEIQFIENDKSK